MSDQPPKDEAPPYKEGQAREEKLVGQITPPVSAQIPIDNLGVHLLIGVPLPGSTSKRPEPNSQGIADPALYNHFRMIDFNVVEFVAISKGFRPISATEVKVNWNYGTNIPPHDIQKQQEQFEYHYNMCQTILAKAKGQTAQKPSLLLPGQGGFKLPPANVLNRRRK